MNRRRTILWVLLLTVVCSSAVAAQPSPHPASEVRSVLDTPVEFTGPRLGGVDPAHLGEIRIGIYGPADAPADREGAMFSGALLAVEEINAARTADALPFRLLSRWSGDPWRGGAKDMVRLVYDDRVAAVIGSINGDATHIAEQVITKARVPLLSPISADPTLTYIRIPWMFRLPPHDERQADVLIEAARNDLGISSLGLVTSSHHDDRVFAAALRSGLAEAGLQPAFHLQVPVKGFDAVDVAHRLTGFKADAVMVRLPASALPPLADALAEAGFDVPLLVPWIPELDVAAVSDRYKGRILSVSPFNTQNGTAYEEFARRFGTRFGVAPTAGAAYSYDAVFLIAKAVASGAALRADLRDAIAESSGFTGVTGVVTWDNGGGNTALPVVRRVKGLP